MLLKSNKFRYVILSNLKYPVQMKTLKTILIVLLIIILIPLVTAIFVKKGYAVERDIVINKPKSEVFDYIKYLKNQSDYSKWSSLDPDMKTEFRGVDGTVGFVSAWESEQDNVGKGEQEITGIVEGQRVDYEVRFLEPFESKSPAYLITDSIGQDQTRVTWGFSGKMQYPFNLMNLFVNMEEALGEDFELGLYNMKAIMEHEYGE